MKAFLPPSPPPSSISFVQRLENLAAAGLAKVLPAAFALSALAMPASAATNLVKNGSFETNGGPGAQYLTTLADWTYGGGLASLDTAANAFTNSSAKIQFWGASPGYQNGNGFTGSPDGGYFWAADGDAQYRVLLQQSITGLTVGDKYDLSFDYAYGQEACNGYWCDGATSQLWSVNFGSENFNTGYTYVPEHGFRGWYKANHTFTASAATQFLQFAAVGPSGQPPVALLDGVMLTAQNEPPAPPAATPGPARPL